MSQAPKLLDRVRERIRLKHHSIKIEDSYVQWIRRFMLFHGKRRSAEMGVVEVAALHLLGLRNVKAA